MSGQEQALKPSRGFDWCRLLPRYWLQNEETSREWDAILNALLDAYEPENVTAHTCRLGGVEIWIQNWPYQYGYQREPASRALPMVRTRKRLRKRLIGHNYAVARAAIAKATQSKDTPQ